MERAIEAGLIRIINSVGGLAPKFVSPGMAGMPDRLVLLPGGRILFVECKDTGQKLRPLQRYRKQQLEELGFSVMLIDTKAQLEALRDAICTAQGVRHDVEPYIEPTGGSVQWKM